MRRWYGNLELVLNWGNNGEEVIELATNLYRSPTRTVKNQKYYFKKGITWSTLSSGPLSMRTMPYEGIFDTKGSAIFLNKEADLIQLLAYQNSKVTQKLIEITSPTIDYSTTSIANLPYIKPDSSSVDSLAKSSIDISKLDWDKSESSWDFNLHELIRVKGFNIEEALELYQQYWMVKHSQLRQNEEDLNHIFIKLYELHDEISSEVSAEEITILQKEISVKNGKIVFHGNEVMAQFVSYAVGCMFGRYSLDAPGLVLASQGETLQDYMRKVEKSELEVTFLPDADNIIPVLDDEWFEDDIVGRFCEFLQVTFGVANFAKNLAFVEECLEKDIRKYFVKDFYADHVQRYKRRPIYWLFSSSQGSFNVLIYLHRYTPDTVNTLLNTYLRDYLEKLRTRREHLVRVEADGTGAEKARAAKAKDALDKVLLELQDYERNVLYPLATERIALDLDLGVLVNYNRFGKALRAVPGLNDAKAQKQVREFDWVKTPTTA